MSGNSILLDTNIVLYLLNGDKSLAGIIGKRKPYLSYITEMELLSSPNFSPAEESIIKSFLNTCVIVGMNEIIKESAIKIRKATLLKLPDSIIAATAGFLKTHLLTADTDFNRLKSLYILQYKK